MRGKVFGRVLSVVGVSCDNTTIGLSLSLKSVTCCHLNPQTTTRKIAKLTAKFSLLLRLRESECKSDIASEFVANEVQVSPRHACLLMTVMVAWLSSRN